MKSMRKRAMWERQDRLCPLCELEIPEQDVENVDVCDVDHIVSRAHGGPDLDGNLQLAHVECNRRKGCGCGGPACFAQESVIYVDPDDRQRLVLWRGQEHRCGRCDVVIFPSHVLDRSQVNVKNGALMHAACPD